MAHDVSFVDHLMISHGNYWAIDKKLYIVPIKVPYGDIPLINSAEKIIKDKLKSFTRRDHETTLTFIKLSGVNVT